VLENFRPPKLENFRAVPAPDSIHKIRDVTIPSHAALQAWARSRNDSTTDNHCHDLSRRVRQGVRSSLCQTRAPCPSWTIRHAQPNAARALLLLLLPSGVEVTATSAIAHEMGEGAWNRGSLPIIGALRAATG
jgi:hypothetical protein